jgi:hypothetical protein
MLLGLSKHDLQGVEGRFGGGVRTIGCQSIVSVDNAGQFDNFAQFFGRFAARIPAAIATLMVTATDLLAIGLELESSPGKADPEYGMFFDRLKFARGQFAGFAQQTFRDCAFAKVVKHCSQADGFAPALILKIQDRVGGSQQEKRDIE